ncbi:MAG: signal recognition particle-docking protein FtsY [Myxococcales bacterium]
MFALQAINDPAAPPPGPAQPGTGVPPPAPPGPAPASGAQNLLGVGILLAVALLFVWAFARKRAATRRELQAPESERETELPKEEPETPELPPPAPLPRIPEPRPEVLTEAGRRAQEIADSARQAAEAAEAARLEAKRLLELSRTGDAEAARRAEEAREAANRAREQAEKLKADAEAALERAREEEEQRKKDEYRRRKEQEAEERERRRREAEEAKQREEELRRLEALEAAERKRQEEEAQRRKVEAEAGKTLAEGLSRTKGGFIASLNSLIGRNKVVDESILGELEEVLFSADIGVKTATELIENARERLRKKDLADADKLKDAIREQVAKIMEVGGPPPDFAGHKPYVVMIAGVNGAGKTTTIGKLAAKLTAQGKKVLLAAGDTFRAAATEQLEVWAQRSNVPVVKGKEGSDPGAVVFDAVKRAQTEAFDVLLCDTAGRLHTKAPLMEELRRVKRVMDKAMPGSPHEVLLVLDSTNGQNAIAQAREFHAALNVNGIVLTKLDGTAKGGVIIGISDELKIPVRFVGIGEAIGDLRPFDPKEFVEALFD